MLVTEDVQTYAAEFVNGLNQKLLNGKEPSDLDCGDHLLQKKGPAVRKRKSMMNMPHPFRRASEKGDHDLVSAVP